MIRKSLIGYSVKLERSLISWKSNNQEIISRNTTEAEYKSMASAISEIVWLVRLLREMNVKVKISVKLFCDNNATIQIARNPIFHEILK